MPGILLVDDQRIVLDGLRQMIREMDLGDIYDAMDGQEALCVYEARKPDIILVDIMMPGMDGLALVKKLRSMGAETKIAIVSAYRDFEYARSAMEYHVSHYILKPVTKKKLHPVLLAMKNEIVENRRSDEEKRSKELQFYYMCFYDFLSGKDIFFDFAQFFVNIDAGFRYPYFQVAVFSFENNDIARQSQGPVGVALSGSNITHIIFSAGKGLLICIMNFPRRADADGNMGVEKALPVVPKTTHLGVSMVLEGVNELKSAYRQAESALKESLFKGMCFHVYRDPDRNARESIFTADDNENLVNLLIKGSKTELDEAMKVILTRSSLEKSTIQDMENDIIAMLGYIHTHINRRYPGLVDIKSGMQCILGQSSSFFSLKKALRDFFDQLCDQIKKQGELHKRSDLIERITGYIASNFHKDLSLYDIAAETGFNYTYLSGIFQDEMNVPFTEYLTRVRMEHALSLLKDSKLKIHDVAERCGYADQKYFFRVFKKRFEITPEEYRNRRDGSYPG